MNESSNNKKNRIEFHTIFTQSNMSIRSLKFQCNMENDSKTMILFTLFNVNVGNMGQRVKRNKKKAKRNFN